jgi:hypothetical protein
VSRVPLAGLPYGGESERRDRLGLALQTEGCHRLDIDRVPDEAVGRLTEEYLAGGRRLLEAGRHVHGVPADEALSGRRIASDHLAGVHPDPRR